MLLQSNKAAPNETGGILVGYFENGVLYITCASDSGPQSTESPFLFSRDVDYCQDFLDRIETASLQKIQYVGEWHSHPQSTHIPSQTDIKSLKDIASQHHYAVKEAVSIIISKDNELGVTIHQNVGSFKRFTTLIVPESYPETNSTVDTLSTVSVEKEHAS